MWDFLSRLIYDLYFLISDILVPIQLQDSLLCLDLHFSAAAIATEKSETMYAGVFQNDTKAGVGSTTENTYLQLVKSLDRTRYAT